MPTNLILSSKEEMQITTPTYHLKILMIILNYKTVRIYINKIDGNLSDGFEIRGKLKIKVS